MAFITLGTVAPGDVLRANSGTAAYNSVIGNVADIRAAQINVKSTIKTDTFTMASATFADVTGLSVQITPSAATSKVLVIVSIHLAGTAGGTNAFGKVVRDSTDIFVGATAGSRKRSTFFSHDNDGGHYITAAHLDSPATTSLTTYKVQVSAQAASTVAVNRSIGDADSTSAQRTASSITVIEVPV
jgi:hypothetical protein